jgi:GntR family transcriptional repressor for pyruvate dehydrogenase complex
LIKFQPLKSRRLSELIEESIKDLVLSGQLEVGSKMPSESEISRQFGVSVVTVREALRGLEAFGIIERRRGKKGGTYIANTKIDVAKNAIHYFLTSKQFSPAHLNQVRAIIEPRTVKLAVKNITKSELKKIEDNVNYCRRKINRKGSALSPRDFFDIEDRHTEFHRLIAEATHNPLLSLIVDYTLDFLSSYEKAHLTPDIEYSLNSLKNHEGILNDLKSGDVQAAKRHMLKDIRFIGNYLSSKVKTD